MSKKILKSMIKEQLDDVVKIWIKTINSNEIKEISSQYKKYKVLFQKESFEETLTSHQSWDHEIKLKSRKSSTKRSIYSLTQKKLKALKKYIDENLTNEFIKKSQSSTDYSILFVSKKDEKQRLCVDYKELNNITIKNNYSLLLIEKIQDRIVDAKIFIKFDISKAYNRIRIKKKDEWKSAFRTRFEHFEYLVMSFELTNASATFQTYINNVLRKYLNKFVTIYLNDILIYFRTKKEHVYHVQKVLEAMKRVNLRVKLEKNEFHQKEVKFFDHILFNTKIKSNSKKLEAILTWFTFKKLVKIQFFVRLTNYDKKFVKEYSIIAKSLIKLIKKTQSFEWNKKQKQTFQIFKETFINSTVLKHAESNLSYVIKMNASNCEIKEMLLQIDKNNKKRLIVYHSKKMIEAEQNYDIHDKELLAIVDALKKWKVQLKETKHQVQMMSNHKNLTYFQITKVLNRRQARWAKKLATYNFRITHCKEINNVRIDALSKRFDYMINKLHQKQQILKKSEDSLIYHKIAIIQLNSKTK